MFVSSFEGFNVDTYVEITNTDGCYWQEVGWQRQNKAAEVVKASGARRANNLYECEQLQERHRGPAANIDKDIRADQAGSTRAAGLITERDAGKQTLTREL